MSQGNDTTDLDAVVGGPIVMQMQSPAAERVTSVDGEPFLILPKDERLEDLEHLAERPRRIRRVQKLLTLDSLGAYIDRHKQPGSAVFVDGERFRIEAILDYHEPTLNDAAEQLPMWCAHRASYEFPLTPDWEAWTSRDGKWLPQPDFAEFLEEHAHNITTPAAAQMLEIARTLSGTRNVNWTSAIHEQSGDVHINYEPQSNVRAGKAGAVEIPERFELTIQPFRGSAPYVVEVRFRYRIQEGGGLHLSYRLLRHDKVVQDAFYDEITRFTGTVAEGVQVFEGQA